MSLAFAKFAVEEPPDVWYVRYAYIARTVNGDPFLKINFTANKYYPDPPLSNIIKAFVSYYVPNAQGRFYNDTILYDGVGGDELNVVRRIVLWILYLWPDRARTLIDIAKSL